ncbi:MAG: hypothetical protein KIT84_40385 [Labilithrix sp.]|nr:hypothetical protein [Labilithrix sp.]MCW5817326.1 hypothetical protein [Labilithrix sp.]
MKKLALAVVVGVFGFVAFATTAPGVANAEPQPNACKPAGASCKDSQECCGACTWYDGKGTCQGG